MKAYLAQDIVRKSTLLTCVENKLPLVVGTLLVHVEAAGPDKISSFPDSDVLTRLAFEHRALKSLYTNGLPVYT